MWTLTIINVWMIYGEPTMYGNGETNLIIKTGGNKVTTKITSMSDDT